MKCNGSYDGGFKLVLSSLLQISIPLIRPRVIPIKVEVNILSLKAPVRTALTHSDKLSIAVFA